MIDRSIALSGWFEQPGAYVLVDGQFGSTGKGLMAGWLAEYGRDKITHVTTNAGPNSGHTAYFDERMPHLPDGVSPPLQQDIGGPHAGLSRVMTQQIPVASVFLRKIGYEPITLLNAGAVIDPDILLAERQAYGLMGADDILVHPNAAVITDEDRLQDQVIKKAIAGTGKGIGPAQAAKVLRTGGLIAQDFYMPMLPAGFKPNRGWDRFWDWDRDVVFVETAQGYSLGINSSRFYPRVTSRECTVMQACADARIPASRVKKVIACYRTFPIRVGNTENSSGGCYEDQQETTWEAIGVEPELTTVTKRVRRVFTWSRVQFRESVAANEPDVLFLNFLQYLPTSEWPKFITDVMVDYRNVMGRLPDRILIGTGPHSHDIAEWR